MLSQLIQRQVPIGSRVIFSLKTGEKVAGVLVELGQHHVTLDIEEGSSTILIEMIGSWKVEKNASEISHQNDVATTPSSVKNTLPVAPGITATPPHPSFPVTSEEVTKRLLEIEARFHAQLQVVSLEITPPDFSAPPDEFKGKHGVEALSAWNRIKDKYEYAIKINELSPKFGRIQPIFNELKSLSERFPGVVAVKRHLAHFYWLLGDTSESLKLWQEAALGSGVPWDWYNLAVVALKCKQNELACFSLKQFFCVASITVSEPAWYVYVKLIKEMSNYLDLSELVKCRGDKFSEKEAEILIETAIYLLKVEGQDQPAALIMQKWSQGESSPSMIQEALGYFTVHSSEAYQRLVSEMEELIRKTPRQGRRDKPQGYIYKYVKERGFGFIRGLDGEDYFFHRSAISADDELVEKINKLSLGEQIPIEFETTAQGPKGPLAIGVTLYRTIDELFKSAIRHADEGDYSKAISQIKKVLELNPNYPSVQDLLERWRGYARMTGVPQGSNPFARAKRAQLIERDLEKAVQLLRLAIQQGDNVESAIKDLANILNQQGKPKEAIRELLVNRDKIVDQKSVDNMLISLYQNAGEYSKSIELLEKMLVQATTESKRIQILFQIAYCYFRQEDYLQAEQKFREVLKKQRNNRAAQRNLAVCLLRQNKYEEAQKILVGILSESPDPKAAELLERIENAKTGQSPDFEEFAEDYVGETTNMGFPREVSKFTQFFLDKCDYQGVPPDRVQSKKFNRTDIRKLEELATRLGTSRPRDRASYYLSAAKIISILEDNEDPNLFHRYLCRSFASQGDSLVADGRPLDAAREYYIEALSAVDGDQKLVEQDAVNALVRYLFSTLGYSYVPLRPNIPSIDETLEAVLSQHPDRNRFFEFITHLAFRSHNVAQRLLQRLFIKSSLQAMAVEYLKNKGIQIETQLKKFQDFMRLWNEIIKRYFDEYRAILDEFRFLAKMELKTAALEDRIERIKQLLSRLFLELDRDRTVGLQKILEMALELSKQVTFEEQERLCIQIDHRCEELLEDIYANPTKLAVEEIHPLIELIQNKVRARLNELYESSTPKLELRLPVESYTPDHNGKIETQIVVKNQLGCSPAEALELVIQEYENTFTVPLDVSLRGGEQKILRVPIQISEETQSSQAFSLPVYAQYRTRSGENIQTPVNNFSIRLSSEEEFEEIGNPYAIYAEGGIVDDPFMFYGREELITNLTKTLSESRTQSKCVVIYGQKRAGKSSILYHLKKKLERNENLIILDLGNIGSILDEHASYSFLYQFLFGILRKLQYAVEDRIESGYTRLDVTFPMDREFYEHPSPLFVFNDTFERFRRAAERCEDWKKKRFILLVDEFSYIYGYITKGIIPDSFMKNWKALLEAKYFSAVLVGQDVMPKFKHKFPNEFGVVQDERVTYLKREDAERLIDEPIRFGGRHGTTRYRERAIDRIIDLTACSPFYIQILCNRLVEYMNRKRASLVTEADVEQVKEELIRGVNALTLDKFDNLLNSGDTSEEAISDDDALKVLTAIAVNSQTGPASRYNIDCETQIPVDEVLDDLVKRDIIERDRGIYYSIKVGLFKEWLIAHQ